MKHKKMIIINKCPICGKAYMAFPALSRYDNKTSICPECGIVEAFAPDTIHFFRRRGNPFKAYAHGLRQLTLTPAAKALFLSKDLGVEKIKKGELK